MTTHRSGFVNIIGRPNVGKSTLLNAMVGERMSIISNKPQTTRHRIIGLLSDEDFQVVFSDTPGIISKPSYKMHEAMNRFAHSTFEDADLMLLMTEPGEKYEATDPVLVRLSNVEVPKFLVLNKIDTLTPEKIEAWIAQWAALFTFDHVIPISALEKINTDLLLKHIIETLPEGPAYYPKDQITDRPERFFVSEIIREKIFLQYEQEIPYSCEVVVTDFKDTETKEGLPLARISTVIFVSRESQKPILLGKNGAAMKKLATAARQDIEIFLERKVFLEVHIKVRDNWRDDERVLKHFGYTGS